MILKNATILNADFELVKKDIKIDGQTIVDIADCINGENEVDYSGKTIVPGVIDIHTHGAALHDHCSGDKEGLARVCEFEAKNGVTSFLPTTMTVSEDMLIKATTAVAEFMKTQKSGATPLGVHLEGPFFSMSKRGAQPAEYIKEPNADMFYKIYDACGKIVKIIDIAPETNGALEFIDKVKDTCTVSIGHTAADYETTKKGFEAGATHTVHLYNAMTGATHREPGVAGAVWDNDSVTAELICDGVHIHPAIIRTTFKLLGKRVVMISDSLSGTGLKDGESFLDAGGHTITINNGKATLDDGTIAGSTTNLFECVRRTISFGIKFEDAFYAATYAPAKVIGVDNVLGSIDIGKRADLVVIDDKLNIEAVYIKGKREA